MIKKLYGIITSMRTRKDGKPDKRFKKEVKTEEPNVEIKKAEEPKLERVAVRIETNNKKLDPQELFNHLLEMNGLKIDFDVLEGTVSTKYGVIKLEKPTLVIKASYV